METKNLRKKLVISADDFGISVEANANILYLAKNRKIDRVAVMINAVEISAKNTAELKKMGLKLDIHLDMPASGKGRGILRRSFMFLYHHLKSGREIENEWKSQIEKFQDIFGKNPDGLNSHQYVHFFPPYFKITVKLCKKYNIHYLRFGTAGIIKKRNSVSQVLHHLHQKNKRTFNASELQSSNFLASLDWFQNINNFPNGLPDGKTELICHPERKTEYDLIKRLF
jgi:predicted glycoside hydrolase/deacetylase ChbG (UPF0249 family)